MDKGKVSYYDRDDTISFMMNHSKRTRLLTKDEEQELGKRKEKYVVAIADRVLGFPYTPLLLDQTQKAIQDGKMPWTRIFEEEESEDDGDSESDIPVERDFTKERNLFQQFYAPNGNLAVLLREVSDIWWTGFVNQALNPLRDYCKLAERERHEHSGSLDNSIEKDIRELKDKLGLTPPEAQQYLIEIQSSERRLEEITNKVVNANIGLVISIAKKYNGRGLDFADLIQEGSLGCIRGWQKFDYSRGYKFSSYAVPWIRQGITRAIADKAKCIRIPVHLGETIYDLRGKSKKFYNENGREPTAEELAEIMKLPLKKIRNILDTMRLEPFSLEGLVKKFDEEDEGNWEESYDIKIPEPKDEGDYTNPMKNKELNGTLSKLSPRKEKVLRMRYGIIVDPDQPLQQQYSGSDEVTESLRAIEAKAYRAVHKSK